LGMRSVRKSWAAATTTRKGRSIWARNAIMGVFLAALSMVGPDETVAAELPLMP
jgi:hypothetical protein